MTRTGTQNRPYNTSMPIMVKAVLIFESTNGANRAKDLIGPLVPNKGGMRGSCLLSWSAGWTELTVEFDWENREAVRCFATLSDLCIRDGGSTLLEAVK